jgi:nucleotide-binding universal stress UspA family protein
VRMGLFFEELKTVCERINPYAVVMGSQGTTAAERLFFGSHTVHAMKHLVWPLLTIPPQVRFSSIKKIGLACDFNKVVDTTPVDEIKTLVNDFHAELHVLNTGKKEVFKPELVFESGLLQEMLVALKPEYHFIATDNTDEGIMNFAEKNHIDLLVVLPKRHGLLEKLLLKSHSKQLVLHSHVPVMALH